MKRYSIGPGLVLVSVAALAHADVIFPAFAGPYVTAGLYPIAIVAILGSEAFVYRMISPKLSVRHLALLVVAANLLSSVAGFVLSAYLPSGLVTNPVRHIVEVGPDFWRYFAWSFVLAYFLSILLEGAVLAFAARRYPVRRPWLTSALANTASYVLLVCIFWLETAAR